MKVSTKAVWQMNEDWTWALVTDEWFEYSGPVAECKKGRKRQEAMAEEQLAQARKDAAVQAASRAAAEPFVTSLEGGRPGEISPYFMGDFGGEMENIARAYRNMRQMDLRTLGQRGWGRAPSGFETSAMNTRGREQAEAETEAFRRGLDRTYQGHLQALGYRTGQQGQYNPTPAYGQAARINEAIPGMGSTLGDIGQGIMMAAPAIAAPFTGGASLAAYGIPGFGQMARNRRPSSYPPSPDQPGGGYSPGGPVAPTSPGPY